jgi:hypothetical protein
MKQSPAMPWVLALLDDGLRIYRRNLLGFVLIGSAVLVPVAVLDLLVNAFVTTQLGDDWIAASVFLRLLLLYPILLYTAGALSRATVMAVEGVPLRVGEALRIGIGRTLSMGCYNILFSIIISMFFSIVGFVIVCPLLYGSLFGIGFLGAFGGSGTVGAAGGLFGVLVVVSVVFNIALSGAQIVGIIYAVQPFVLEQRSFGSTLSRNVDLLTFRFGRNILAFLGAGTIFGMLVVVYAGTLIGGGVALFELLDIEPSPLAVTSLTVVLTAASAVLFFPPAAIWMALLHRRGAQERDAADLVASVEQWRASLGEPRI